MIQNMIMTPSALSRHVTPSDDIIMMDAPSRIMILGPNSG